jgi:effector-binding domain-containing protein
MFRIGEFSKLSRVSARALRLYDRMGLLRPAEVDRYTGYRYYTAAQFMRLNRIVALKDMGFTLEEIAALLDGGLDGAELRGIFKAKRAAQLQNMQTAAELLTRVESRLKLIETEDTMGKYDVILKDIAPLHAVSLRTVIRSVRLLGKPWQEMMCYIERRKIEPSGPLQTIYHDGIYKERDLDVEAVVPVATKAPEEEGFKNGVIPGTTAAPAAHKGPYTGLIEAYGALLHWIEDNGYTVTGPERELYYEGHFSTDDPEQFVTEIQIPVGKR